MCPGYMDHVQLLLNDVIVGNPNSMCPDQHIHMLKHVVLFVGVLFEVVVIWLTHLTHLTWH